MQILNGLKVGVNASVIVLTRMYGINCKVYYPTNIKNLQHGFYDDDIEYPDEPDYEDKLLIPALYTLNETTLPGVFDDVSTGDEKILYIPNTITFPRFSLITTEIETGTFKFRINDEVEWKDDVSIIFRKYVLVPVLSHVNDDNELIEESQEEFDEMEEDNHFNYSVDYDITTTKDNLEERINFIKEDEIESTSETSTTNVVYKPIK